MLRVLYVVAIGLLFAAVIGLGFAAFYSAPKYPDYPTSLSTPAPSGGQTAEQKADQQKYDQLNKDFNKEFQTYNRNMSIMLIISALIILAISMLGLGKIEVIGDGLTMGGVFTLFHGLVRSFMSEDEKMRFIAVLIGLAVILFLSYWQFTRKPKVSPVET